jgi:crotonobetainyl-CoA:carnitine CoA-transferase CaiB-like acyl-CoA transferase
MITDNIFSGLKVVDLASFVAGPGAAVILSDFGADVIKVEPPNGDLWRMANKVPPQPLAKEAYTWHSTIDSPIQVHGVAKVPAKRAPELGEHNEEILKELGFDAKEIDGFRTSGTLGRPNEPAKGT